MRFPDILQTILSWAIWSRVIDVLLVAFILYRLLLLVRGTRALQILGGLGTLVLALYVSSRFQLNTLNWLLSQILPLGPVAIVILFYPELRHALEEFGPRFWSRGFNLLTKDKTHTMIAVIAKSASHLSAQRIGALIVIERQTGLDAVISTGTRLDAEVSLELLETLFYKGTALHDGAAVIRRGRIVAGGCILPLTDRPRIEAAIHTRHKAALGMSENSDAIIVVVSEETGTISLAVDGKLIRGLNEAKLTERLYRLLNPVPERPAKASKTPPQAPEEIVV